MASFLFVVAILAVAHLSIYRLRLRRFERARWGVYDAARGQLDMDRCLRVLVTNFGSDTFQAPELVRLPIVERDREVFLRRALELAAERLQVSIPPDTVLTYASRQELGFAGGDAHAGTDWWQLQVSGDQGTLHHAASGDGVWRIRVLRSLQHQDEAVGVVVAHELAHCVLYRDGLPGGDEHLTDAFVVLAGYGPLVLRHRMGYLHPRAVKYLMDQRRRLAAS